MHTIRRRRPSQARKRAGPQAGVAPCVKVVLVWRGALALGGGPRLHLWRPPGSALLTLQTHLQKRQAGG
jgi:hypothetical protein